MRVIKGDARSGYIRIMQQNMEAIGITGDMKGRLLPNASFTQKWLYLAAFNCLGTRAKKTSGRLPAATKTIYQCRGIPQKKDIDERPNYDCSMSHVGSRCSASSLALVSSQNRRKLEGFSNPDNSLLSPM